MVVKGDGVMENNNGNLIKAITSLSNCVAELRMELINQRMMAMPPSKTDTSKIESKLDRIIDLLSTMTD